MFAQGTGLFTDPLDGAFDMSGYLSENAFGALPVPIIISEPAVDQGLGVAGLFFHESEEEAKRRKQMMQESENAARFLLPPSVSVLAAGYTGNGSWFTGAGHFGFYNKGRQRYQGFVGYGDFTLDYYSIGDINLDKPFSLQTKGLGVVNSYKWRLGSLPIFAGPHQRYISTELSPGAFLDRLPDEVPPELVEPIEDLLTADTVLSGLGFDIELDTRDSVFTPMTGTNIQFRAVFNRDAIGSDIDYDNYRLEALQYLKINAQWRLGLRFAAETVESDDTLPPFAKPGLNLRGVPAARYQGDRTALAEGELTWQFNPRWSVLGFLGAGRAWTQRESFGDVGSAVNRGMGFRYKIARSYGLHAGLDLARGPEDTVLYFQVGSAW